VDAAEARVLALQLMAQSVPARWEHVQGVAGRASTIAASVGDTDETLASAAWLHDIGYASELALTGFHPLDGARYLESIGAPWRLICLVARHSAASTEAALRGFEVETAVAAFTDEGSALRDALWYCDLTTSPNGKPVTAKKRIREIRRTYGPGNVGTRAITTATPELLAAVQRTEHLLAQQQAGA
jgi:hypothetical protein